ncbi:GNAT family N-acetyltransferase, partial [Lactobacillus jensenii]|nr:GNAT family N-acetyltransferase [Lactobacillus jensenii]
MWYVKKWTELTPDEIWQILDLRISTIVVEQKRIYHEIDKTDLSALHVFAIENDKIVAYARVFLDGKH